MMKSACRFLALAVAASVGACSNSGPAAPERVDSRWVPAELSPTERENLVALARKTGVTLEIGRGTHPPASDPSAADVTRCEARGTGPSYDLGKLLYELETVEPLIVVKSWCMKSKPMPKAEPGRATGMPHKVVNMVVEFGQRQRQVEWSQVLDVIWTVGNNNDGTWLTELAFVEDNAGGDLWAGLGSAAQAQLQKDGGYAARFGVRSYGTDPKVEERYMTSLKEQPVLNTFFKSFQKSKSKVDEGEPEQSAFDVLMIGKPLR